MRALIVLALLAACADPGRPIDAWVFDVDGGPRGVAITLPSPLLRELPMREGDFAMHADVALGATERGAPLTLAFDCYHGPLALTVDGAPIPDVGEVAVGEHRFVIPGSRTQHATLELALTAHEDEESFLLGFGATPRLEVGERHTRASIAAFNWIVPIASGTFALVMALLFGMLFVFDRRRRANGVFALAASATIAGTLWEVDLAPTAAFGMGLCVTAVSVAYFIHLEFGVRSPPRWIAGVFGALFAAFAISPISYPFGRITVIALNVAQFPLYVYFVLVLVRLARAPERRSDAWTLLGALALTSAAFAPFALMATLGVSVAGGRHVESLGYIAWLAGVAIVLARQHVARNRSLELTTAELQHQVAERTRALADSLAKIARGPQQPLGEPREIDGRYRVIQKLGVGGMGTVYEVERIAGGDRLALKMLRGRAHPEAVARFAREAQIAATTIDPYLLPVVDVGIADDGMFIVMPLVDGGSIEQQRERFGDAAWARPLLAQIASGLAALHSRDIVHRDLKPANILLDHGVARIADFGLAVAAAEVRAATEATGPFEPVSADATTGVLAAGLTRTGVVFGTPQYMAPELAVGVRRVRPSSDIFAFGLIAVEMLTGRAAFSTPPFVTGMSGGTLAAPNIDGVSADIAAIIARCLAGEPDQRPTAGELITVLAVPGHAKSP